tara:strand:+ start:158 stop:787 length:630 start_codon:yes stop_codon:yes gene_type:complete
MKEIEIIRAQASKISVFSSIISSIVFGGIAIALSVNVKNSDWIVIALGLASIGALLYLRKARELILTNRKLIINWLYFPRSDEFLLSDLEEINEEDFNLSASHTSNSIGGTESKFHEGRRAKIKFKSNKSEVLFDSYNNENYYKLMRQLKYVTKNMESDFKGDIDQYAQFEQLTYGRQSHLWFGLIMTLTTPLIIIILYNVILPMLGLK